MRSTALCPHRAARLPRRGEHQACDAGESERQDRGAAILPISSAWRLRLAAFGHAPRLENLRHFRGLGSVGARPHRRSRQRRRHGSDRKLLQRAAQRVDQLCCLRRRPRSQLRRRPRSDLRRRPRRYSVSRRVGHYARCRVRLSFGRDRACDLVSQSTLSHHSPRTHYVNA